MALLSIDGRTSAYALIGQNIDFSPVVSLYNSISAFIGYNSVMLPYVTAENEFGANLEALRQLKYRGVYIDTPYRCEVEKLLITMTDEASSCEAVNVIRIDNEGLHGHNTEINAFRRAFPTITGETLKRKRVFMIGSGGIARAIALACVLEECASLTIANRTTEKARQLCSLINLQFKNAATVADYTDAGTIHSFYKADIIIHAGSAGMFPDLNTFPLPDDYQLMPHHLVIDTIYNPPNSKLLQAAEEKGCKWYNVSHIMFYACLEAFQWWSDVRVDAETEKKLFHIWKEILYNN